MDRQHSDPAEPGPDIHEKFAAAARRTGELKQQNNQLISEAAISLESRSQELRLARARRTARRADLRRVQEATEQRRLQAILDAADARDLRAQRRDRVADARDLAASQRRPSPGSDDALAAGAEQDRAQARLDRFWAGRDRDDAASDRFALLHHGRAVAERHRRETAEDDREIANLIEALDSRSTIGTAVGLLMPQANWTPQTAYDQLVRASQRSNRKLRDIAGELVERTSQRAVPDRAVSDQTASST